LDEKESFKYSKMAAEAGDPFGMYHLGRACLTGNVTDIDQVKGLEWFKRGLKGMTREI
jgi:TPR repeat protein